MAVDHSVLTQYPGGNTVRVLMDAAVVSGRTDVTEVKLPSWAAKVTLAFYASDDSTSEAGWFEFEGTDGDPPTVNAFPVLANGSYVRGTAPVMQTPGQGLTLYLAGSTASGYCHIDLEP